MLILYVYIHYYQNTTKVSLTFLEPNMHPHINANANANPDIPIVISMTSQYLR